MLMLIQVKVRFFSFFWLRLEKKILSHSCLLCSLCSHVEFELDKLFGFNMAPLCLFWMFLDYSHINASSYFTEFRCVVVIASAAGDSLLFFSSISLDPFSLCFNRHCRSAKYAYQLPFLYVRFFFSGIAKYDEKMQYSLGFSLFLPLSFSPVCFCFNLRHYRYFASFVNDTVHILFLTYLRIIVYLNEFSQY